MGMSSGGSGAPGAVQSEINVTPLIDVLLVLLIIFLVIMPVMMKMETLEVPRTIDEIHTPDPDASPLTVTVKKDLSVVMNDGNNDIPVAAIDLAKTLRPKLAALHVGVAKVVFVDFEPEVPWRAAVETMDTIRSLASDVDHDEITVALKIRPAAK
ncbi:MAG TPA: biopolymer transporter ExbD [Kofleriaceae bacterium]|jgi:biopolymer transport protein ExbD